MERKKDEYSLSKQNRILQVPIEEPVYYFAQEKGVSQRFDGTEDIRQLLLKKVQEGQIRKVLAKYDISLVEEDSLEDILDQLQRALMALEPYYLATRQV